MLIVGFLSVAVCIDGISWDIVKSDLVVFFTTGMFMLGMVAGKFPKKFQKFSNNMASIWCRTGWDICSGIDFTRVDIRGNM